MQTTPPSQKPPLRTIVAFFASAGLGLVLASALAFLACYFGLLFDGLEQIFTVLVTAGICTVVTTVSAVVFKRKGKHFTWRTLSIEVIVLALVAVSSLSWLQTRQSLQIIMDPAPVPRELRVHHGRGILFSSYVHFSAPPEVIARLIQLKGLAEVPNDPEKATDSSGWGLQQSTKNPWDWWQPAKMANPRFFYRHHDSLAIQGWSEGWWVNDATNEVYATLGG